MRWSTGIVLIVDREEEVSKVLRTALQSTDYVLLQAKTGDEALAVLSRLQFPVDLAIIDLDLPSADSLAASLLTMLGHRNIMKIIIKTSREDKPFLEQVKYFRIDAIVLQPVSEERFIKTVHASLSGHQTGSGDASAETAA